MLLSTARARTTAEVLLTYLRESLPPGLDRERSVRGYRGGYLPNQRRQIEAEYARRTRHKVESMGLWPKNLPRWSE